MSKSITRKFLVRELPNLSDKSKDIYQRYYLYNNNSIVIRIQQINNDYELERKASESTLIREGETINISKDEFEKLKKNAIGSIQRDSYIIQDNPKIVLRIYHGGFEGLIRAEVNFTSETEAQSFSPLEWFSKEITGTPLAQDGDLLKLSKDSFNNLLNNNN
jgi:CYTH domain-containing protein